MPIIFTYSDFLCFQSTTIWHHSWCFVYKINMINKQHQCVTFTGRYDRRVCGGCCVCFCGGVRASSYSYKHTGRVRELVCFVLSAHRVESPRYIRRCWSANWVAACWNCVWPAGPTSAKGLFVPQLGLSASAPVHRAFAYVINPRERGSLTVPARLLISGNRCVYEPFTTHHHLRRPLIFNAPSTHFMRMVIYLRGGVALFRQICILLWERAGSL